MRKAVITESLRVRTAGLACAGLLVFAALFALQQEIVTDATLFGVGLNAGAVQFKVARHVSLLDWIGQNKSEHV